MLAQVDGWGHMSGAMSAYGWLVMLLVTFLVIWVVWSIATDHRPRDRALELLDERYAEGDIDRDRYLEQKADLKR